jgi:hypothetical protein
MHKLITLLYLIFSLAGCDHTRTIVLRSSVDGADQLYSRTTVLTLSTLFECIHSQSGHCYYGVFSHQCAATPACTAPLQQFALNSDSQRRVLDLPPDFELCVSAEATPMTRDCLLAGAASNGGVSVSG